MKNVEFVRGPFLFSLCTGKNEFETCPLESSNEHQWNTITAGDPELNRLVEVATIEESDLYEGLFAANWRRNGEDEGTELGNDPVFGPIVGAKVVEFVWVSPRSLSCSRVIFCLALGRGGF